MHPKMFSINYNKQTQRERQGEKERERKREDGVFISFSEGVMESTQKR